MVHVDGALGVQVSRESVYDTELYRILLSWLTKYSYEITSQWHILLDADEDDKDDKNVYGKK